MRATVKAEARCCPTAGQAWPPRMGPLRQGVPWVSPTPPGQPRLPAIGRFPPPEAWRGNASPAAPRPGRRASAPAFVAGHCLDCLPRDGVPSAQARPAGSTSGTPAWRWRHGSREHGRSRRHRSAGAGRRRGRTRRQRAGRGAYLRKMDRMPVRPAALGCGAPASNDLPASFSASWRKPLPAGEFTGTSLPSTTACCTSSPALAMT